MRRGRYVVVDQETGMIRWFERLPEATEYARELVEIEKTAHVGKRAFEKITIARMCYQMNEEGELQEFQA